MWQWFHKWGSAKWFYQISRPWSQAFGALALVFLTLGLVWGFVFSPADYQMNHNYRIMYLHVPAAMLAQIIYLLMAILGLISLVWKMKIAPILARAVLPFGASCVLLALLSGAFWGKPTWGTYWIWDARLTSTLFLFFLYMGLWACYSLLPASMGRESAYKAAAIVAIVGSVNIPIIKFSVEWWNTLHQPASIRLTERPAMPASMYLPLFASILGFYFLMLHLMLKRARLLLLEQEMHKAWAAEAEPELLGEL